LGEIDPILKGIGSAGRQGAFSGAFLSIHKERPQGEVVMEKKTEWARKSYWEEFHKKYPDPTALRSFVAPDSILTKIFNFSSVPTIWNIRDYRFDEKLKELQTVSEADREHLEEIYWTETDKQKQDWLEYLNNTFGVTSSTVMFKQKLDADNKALRHPYAQGQILEMVENEFQDYISVNDVLTSTERQSERFWRNGRWYPLFTRVAHKKGSSLQVSVYHYYDTPSDIKSSFERDAFTVKAYRKYQFDNLFDSHAFTFTVQHYYDGQPLLKEPLELQMAKRYAGLLQMSAKEIAKRLRYDSEEALHEAKIALIEACKKYDSGRGPVVNFFNLYLKKYYPGKVFDEHSTIAGTRFCNFFCKGSKEEKGELPCEYETTAGVCRDLDKQRVLRSNLEHSGGSLDKALESE
jgi:hypothetical protein